MTNGVSDDYGPSPTIFVDKNSWSGKWSGGRELELTTSRTFSCLESALMPLDEEPNEAADVPRDAVASGESEQLDISGLYSMPKREQTYDSAGLDVPSRLGDSSVGAYFLRSYTSPRLSWGASPQMAQGPVLLPTSWPVFESVKTFVAPADISANCTPCAPSPPAAQTVGHQVRPASEIPLPTSAVPSSRKGSPEAAQTAKRRGEADVSKGVPEHLPDEIDVLCKAHAGGIPVAIIMHTEWPSFPLEVNDRCKFVVLGFFHIVGIKTKLEPLPPHTRKNGVPRCRGQVTWAFTFRWTPGGDLSDNTDIDTGIDIDIDIDIDINPDMSMDVDISPDTSMSIDGSPPRPSPHPWWLAPTRIHNTTTTTTAPGPENAAAAVPAPAAARRLYSPDVLNASILARHIARDRHSAGAASRSWHCGGCGKVNRTRWMGRHPCSYCPPPDPDDPDTLYYPAELVDANLVRDRLRPTPLWSAFVHVPPGVTTRVRDWKSGLRWYTYTYTGAGPAERPGARHAPPHSPDPSAGNTEGTQAGVDKGKRRADAEGAAAAGRSANANALVVHLLFLGNRAELEKDADGLFTAFQQFVPMVFESTPLKPTAGVFTFTVSPAVEPGAQQTEGRADWSSAPECIRKVRTMMVASARRCEQQNVSDASVTHLSAVAWLGDGPAKNELHITANAHPVVLLCLGCDLDITFGAAGERRAGRKPKSASKPQRGRPKARADAAGAPPAESPPIAQAAAGTGEEPWRGEDDDAQSPQTKTPASLKPEHLQIRLTHGSTLVLSGGCDVDLTIIRTEFAILLRGYREV